MHRIPSNDEVETAIRVLELEERDVIRKFYDRERREDARKRWWRLGWRIIKGILMVIGVLAILAFCAALWLFPGGLP